MRKNILSKNIRWSICILLIIAVAFPMIVQANSMPKYIWGGGGVNETTLLEEGCPIVVTNELLAFNLQEFPKDYYERENEFSDYSGELTAEYSFYNPTDEKVRATLAFPVGKRPEYYGIPEETKYVYRIEAPGIEIGNLETQLTINTANEKTKVAVNGYRRDWNEYEISLEPGETIVNKVTAPIYPSINMEYKPYVYEYIYLTSPAKLWGDFGELKIVINTPFYMTDSSEKGFKKTETGYELMMKGLPEEELEFSLSEVKNPKIDPDIIWYEITLIIYVLGVPLLMVALLILLFWLVRRLREKEK